MKNFTLKALSYIALTAFSATTFASPNPSENASKGSAYSTLGASHMAAGSVQSAASVVALPLIAVGSIGVASAATASEIDRSLNAYEPLEITEITITQDPSPTKAMQ